MKKQKIQAIGKDGVIKGFGVYVLLDNSDKYIACPMNIDVQVYYKD